MLDCQCSDGCMDGKDTTTIITVYYVVHWCTEAERTVMIPAIGKYKVRTALYNSSKTYIYSCIYIVAIYIN